MRYTKYRQMPPWDQKPDKDEIYKNVSTCDYCEEGLTDGYFEDNMWHCSKCYYPYGMTKDQYARCPLP